MQYSKRTYYTLLKHSISVCLLVAASPVWANPTGGHLVAGSALIRNGSGTTSVLQMSNRAVINWQGFSIGPGETTQFFTPGANAVTLNRVIGGNPSEILGRLTSNGQIFLVNPNGIVFGKTAHVDVAGLIASTANITNSDFMQGNDHFTNAPAGSFVINQGTITVRQAGLAALVAPNVVNSGTIQATLGKIVLAAGSAFTIDLYGDSLISFDASSLVDNGQVNNLGRIEANGGTVMLTAAAAGQLIENVVNTSGYISAQSVGKQNGRIILQGYDNSTVQVSGTLDVSGTGAYQTGGLIQLSGDNVQLLNGSFLNAQGSLGGGIINVGGGYRGSGPLRHADTVVMQNNALINASALQSGNGGLVTLWSDHNTRAHGLIISLGGALSGNGGFVETSSAQTLDFSHALINTRALNGIDGTWLIDPSNLTIDDAAAATLTTNLASNNVTVTNPAGAGVGDITFTNSVTPVTLTNNHSFTVDATHDLTFNTSDAINDNGVAGNVQTGNITLIAGNDITFNNMLSVHNEYYSGAVSVIAGHDIIFGPTSSAAGFGPIQNDLLSAGTSQAVNLRSDANMTGTGTIVDNTNGGAGGFVIVTSHSPIYTYYNPTSFSSPEFFNLNSLDGSPAINFMLVYNSVSGHTLNDVANAVNSGHFGSYALAQNLSGGLSTPIGTSADPYNGSFQGSSFNGTQTYYTISHIQINTSGSNNVGLFGYVGAGGLISNITLLNSSFTGQNNVGSIIGFNNGGALTNSYSNALVSGGGNVGGLIGYNNGTLTAGFYTGTITASGSNIGGLVGFNDTGGSIFTSLAVPIILGGSNVGGAIGNNLSTTLFAVYASSATFSGPVIGTGTTTGTAPFASMLPAASLTSLPPGFNDPSVGTFWQATGSQNYVSLITCTSIGCQVSLGGPGGLGALAKQYVTTNSILNNNVPAPIPVVNYYIDGSLMYSVPLANGDGIYVITVTPESDTQVVIATAFDALKSAYNCGTSP